MSRIIISDIHGCFCSLVALLKQCPDLPVTIAGDLVDRGPRSIDVIEFVQENRCDCVLGNHDDMMVEANSDWILFEGAGTNDEYTRIGNQEGMALFHRHREWLSGLPVFRKYDDEKSADGRSLVVSHSNLLGRMDDFTEAADEKTKDAVIWNRDALCGNSIPDNDTLYNVFGHTQCYLINQVSPTDPSNFPVIRGHYAAIDTGCAYGGFLSALIFPEMKVIRQENID